MLNQEEARFNSADMNVAYRMNVDEYQRLCAYSGELEENWGKPPGAGLHSAFSASWLLDRLLPLEIRYKGLSQHGIGQIGLSRHDAC